MVCAVHRSTRTYCTFCYMQYRSTAVMVLHVLYVSPKHSSGGAARFVFKNRQTEPAHSRHVHVVAAMVPQVKKKKAEERAIREKQTRLEEQVHSSVHFEQANPFASIHYTQHKIQRRTRVLL